MDRIEVALWLVRINNIYIYNYIYIYTCIFGEPGESKQFIQIRLTTFYYVLNDSDKHPR